MKVESNLDYPDSLGLGEIVRTIENMNINEEQKLIKIKKRHLIVKLKDIMIVNKYLCYYVACLSCIPRQVNRA